MTFRRKLVSRPLSDACCAKARRFLRFPSNCAVAFFIFDHLLIAIRLELKRWSSSVFRGRDKSSGGSEIKSGFGMLPTEAARDLNYNEDGRPRRGINISCVAEEEGDFQLGILRVRPRLSDWWWGEGWAGVEWWYGSIGIVNIFGMKVI